MASRAHGLVGNLPLSGADSRPRDVDEAVGALAEQQNGLVTAAQLRVVGLTRRRLEDRVARGWLRRVFRGVYMVGAVEPTPRLRAHAAVLATGFDAAATLRTSAAVHRYVETMPKLPQVLTTRRIDGPAGVEVHRTNELLPDDVERIDGIRTTTTTRLLLDLAAAGDPKLVRLVWRQASRRRTLDPGGIARRLPGRPGQPCIVELLGGREEPDTTNDFERDVAAILARSTLGEPEREHAIGDFVLDFFFPDLPLCLEADGFTDHGTWEGYVADRDRDRELYAAHGVLTARVTPFDARTRPDRVLDQLERTAVRLRADAA